MQENILVFKGDRHIGIIIWDCETKHYRSCPTDFATDLESYDLAANAPVMTSEEVAIDMLETNGYRVEIADWESCRCSGCSSTIVSIAFTSKRITSKEANEIAKMIGERFGYPTGGVNINNHEWVIEIDD